MTSLCLTPLQISTSLCIHDTVTRIEGIVNTDKQIHGTDEQTELCICSF